MEIILKSNSVNLLNNSVNIWSLREDVTHSNERKLTIPKEHFNDVVLLRKELGFEVVSDEIIVD